jgi:hypothetical protein
MKFPWSSPPPEDDWYIDLTERLAPYTKEADRDRPPAPPASFMRERPLRATAR